MRDSIVFYKSFVEALNELPDEDRLRLYDAILNFGIYDKEPELSGIDAAVFALVRPQIEANNRKYQNGTKGGRPKNQTETKWKPNENQTITKAKPNHNQTITKTKPNHNQSITKAKPNDNDNDNVNVNGNDNGNASGSDEISSLLSFFNSETGSSYKETEQFDELINERLSEGYTFEDLRNVIRKKSAEWSCDGKMRSYLRPSTLFGDKFEEYLNAPMPVVFQDEKQHEKDVEQLKGELDTDRKSLESVESRMSEIQNEGSVKENFDEWTELKLQKEIYRQQIERISKRIEAG